MVSRIGYTKEVVIESDLNNEYESVCTFILYSLYMPSTLRGKIEHWIKLYNYNFIYDTGSGSACCIIWALQGRRGCWIYNYICNRCLSPLTWWVWIQHYVIKFVSDLWHVDSFLQVTLWFPPPITLTATI
jgi:hypothetical protein